MITFDDPMRPHPSRLLIAFSLLLIPLFPHHAVSQTNILTNRYNTARTAANLNETALTTANVNTSTFGKLGAYSVNGVIFAQPLYVRGVTIHGASHNVLYVATMHDVVYAFDADTVGSAPLWTIDFRNAAAGIAPDPVHIGVGDGSDPVIADTFGILSTPVIDLPNNRMFLVTMTLENGTECFRVRSLDIRTGALLASTLVTGSVPAVGSAAGNTFITSKYCQRTALEMINGQVWIAFGSRASGDYTAPWAGWVMTYDPSTLVQTAIFATSRTNGNSIWQSGSGPAVDASGNVYYLTGNGGYYDGATDFPETLLKMNNAGGTLNVSDWYTPDNSSANDYYVTQDEYDLDLSCNGPLLIPGTDLVTFGSKTADVYVLHTGNLGRLTPNDTQLAQFFHIGAAVDIAVSDSDRIVGMAYWKSATGGHLYVWPGQASLHAYLLNTAASTFSQTYAGTYVLPGQPATALAVSANGSVSGTGVLWAPVTNTTYESNVVGVPGILHAYNAENPSQELWNSNLVSSDYMGSLAKFVPPVVVNGKVYMANSGPYGDYTDGSVTVFGLKSGVTHAPPSVSLTSPANGVTFTGASAITLSASATAASGYTISKVSFLDGTTVLATVTTAPYSYVWTSASGGNHTLTAAATDNAGATATSAAITVTVQNQSFMLTAAPHIVAVVPGQSGQSNITIVPANGFSGVVTLAASGLPAGVTASFGAETGSVSVLTISTPATLAVADYPIKVTAKSAGLSATTIVTLAVSSTTGNGLVQVNLLSSANVYGVFSNGTSPANGGLDGAGYAYSSNLLGTSVSALGVPFVFGTAGAVDAISNATLILPRENYATLTLLGTGVFGSQINQKFVVTYTDGTCSTFKQSLSDWGAPQHYPGETVAAAMAYRVVPGGGTATGPWNLYAYSFAVDSTRTVRSISLPVNRDVVVMAITLIPVGTKISIASQNVGTPLVLAASASSGLPVSFASSTTSICKVSGTTANLLAAGACTITASQIGNAGYSAATPVSRSFTVNASAAIMTGGSLSLAPARAAAPAVMWLASVSASASSVP